MEKESADKGKPEDNLLNRIPGKEDVEAAIKTGDVVKLLANLFPLITVICVVYGLKSGELLWAYIFGGFTLFLLVLTAAVYVNKQAKGWIKYLPPCHDFLLNLKYCSRHRGFYLGLIIGSILEGLKVWTGAANIVHLYIPPGLSSLSLLAVASILPLHGVFTKKGMKSKDRTKFVSAFIWSLLLFLMGHVFYSDIVGW
jgi:hypothetical protein